MLHKTFIWTNLLHTYVNVSGVSFCIMIIIIIVIIIIVIIIIIIIIVTVTDLRNLQAPLKKQDQIVVGKIKSQVMHRHKLHCA